MSDGMAEAARTLAAALRRGGRTVALTGAGASTESGLPDWRGAGGLWRQMDPARVASMTALYHHPVEFYAFYRERLATLRGARPSGAHLALARLEAGGYLHCLVTQNVDGLHRAAGHQEVVEVHGSLARAHCVRCGQDHPVSILDREVSSPADVPRCRCGGPVKPAVVLFEETLPEEAITRAFAEARRADLFIVVGSSLEVGPVNQLPRLAVESGADLAIINLDPTYLDQRARWVMRERAGALLTAVADHLGV